MAASVAESSSKTVQLTGQACGGTIETDTGAPHPWRDGGDAFLPKHITFTLYPLHTPHTQKRDRSCTVRPRDGVSP